MAHLIPNVIIFILFLHSQKYLANYHLPRKQQRRVYFWSLSSRKSLHVSKTIKWKRTVWHLFSSSELLIQFLLSVTDKNRLVPHFCKWYLVLKEFYLPESSGTSFSTSFRYLGKLFWWQNSQNWFFLFSSVNDFLCHIELHLVVVDIIVLHFFQIFKKKSFVINFLLVFL